MFGALGATLVVLVLGIINMFSEQKEENKRSNQLMRWRVIAQLIALAVFTFILFMGKKT
jgi:hypothetical protein